MISFNKLELAALIQLSISMANADGILDENETSFISQNILSLGVTHNELSHILKLASNLDNATAVAIISKLPMLSKQYVTAFLGSIMAVDGNITKSEVMLWRLISNLCDLPEMTIDDAIKFVSGRIDMKDDIIEASNCPNIISSLLSGNNCPPKMETDFKSSDHIRYENSINVSGHNQGCHRTIKIENNINGDIGYSVSIINDDIAHPLWGNNIQMAPKQMKIEKVGNDGNDQFINLIGYGTDDLGVSFADYGMTIYINNDVIRKCILHMFDRNVDIEYL